MKLAIALVALVAPFYVIAGADETSESPITVDKTCSVDLVSANQVSYSTMDKECVDKLRQQINVEVSASIKYLQCATHFLQDRVNLPGFAKMFLEAASEEREHAKKLIDYYIMRGGEVVLNKNTKVELISIPSETVTCTNGTDALSQALQWEIDVTKNIKGVIKKCDTPSATDGFKDDHLIDYLSGDFLDEQYKGQKDIVSKLNTLKKLQSAQGVNLGEFLFDKKILGDGLFN